MKKPLTAVLIICSFVFALDTRLSKADYYYSNSHQDRSYLSKARGLCSEVISENPRSSEALWRMARIKLAEAEGKTSKSEKLTVYESALDYADSAKTADSRSADAHYIYAVILGRTAQTRGLVDFLVQINKIKEEFELALKIDPGHPGALHGLGIWYAEASAFYPAWSSQAHDYLDKALRADPGNSMVYVTLARLYIREKKFAEARKLLETCLALRNPTVPVEFYSYSKPESERLLAEIEGR